MMSNYEMEGGLHFRLMYNSYSLTVFQYDAIMFLTEFNNALTNLLFRTSEKAKMKNLKKLGVLKIM